MVSADGSFKMGFFSPGSSKKRYLGIWYNKVSVMTVVWVANRETPLTNSSGVLKITSEGLLVLLNHNESIIWSSNISRSARNPVALLLDSGNLVVKEVDDNDPENSLWQSFDYPSDTLLPGMKIGRNSITGFDRHLTSWKTTDDPSSGNFTFRFDPRGYPELFLTENSIRRYRSGPWNGLRFGAPQLRPNPVYKYEFVFNDKEKFYRYQLLNNSILSRLVLTQNGDVQRLTWTDKTGIWAFYLTLLVDDCNRYALCGAYGSCDINSSPACGCLKGFLPKVQKYWEMMDWSDGCARMTPLNCTRDVFQKYSGVKLPETKESWFNKSMNLEQCKNMCMKNCSCTAYANLDIREGGSGCLLWFSDLIDIRQFNDNGQDIYIRMAASELEGTKSNTMKYTRVIVISVVLTGMLLLGLVLVLFVWKKKSQKGMTRTLERRDDTYKEDPELKQFDLGVIACATNNFSLTNKLGEGGFGPVYKGMLEDGQEIAVKRLSKSSRQGLDEFKNEVMHIAKLQHRNLVKLLGWCMQADERMLIYEFMPQKSLDIFIFDQTCSALLDWPQRYHIINGIARGLLYLHQDSRLRIIHRDLKASNILLDNNMNPKISDFGIARSFGENKTEAKTNRVMGTYGYISPEYAIDGLYSVKSDVFSFGVLVLEMVNGNRNRGFCHPDHHLNLLGHAWRLFTEGRSYELITEPITESCNLSEALRSIHVGLLCVQCLPNDRPSMSSVVLMLSGEGRLPQPKQPGFFTERALAEANSSSIKNTSCSVNDSTITLLEAR
ncbi:G-type lectin S-receptor serine/threonine-protein kinase [Salix suchowensis]|nr:G-type lectin S-receptor serine/threonine-protein kinase [Salix suchowensis]